MTAAVSGTRRIVERLRAAGMSEGIAHAVARLFADVRTEGFDPAVAHRDLAGAGFTDEQAGVLVERARATSAARREEL